MRDTAPWRFLSSALAEAEAAREEATEARLRAEADAEQVPRRGDLRRENPLLTLRKRFIEFHHCIKDFRTKIIKNACFCSRCI